MVQSTLLRFLFPTGPSGKIPKLTIKCDIGPFGLAQVRLKIKLSQKRPQHNPGIPLKSLSCKSGLSALHFWAGLTPNTPKMQKGNNEKICSMTKSVPKLELMSAWLLKIVEKTPFSHGAKHSPQIFASNRPFGQNPKVDDQM